MTERTSPEADRPNAAPRRRRRLFLALAALGVVVLLLFGRGAAGGWARGRAARLLESGAVGPAERWLEHAGRVDPEAAENDLLRAAAFRRLGDRRQWQEARDAARQRGASAADVERERRLGSLRWGEVPSVGEDTLDRLIDAGASRDEAAAAVIHGLLALGELERAQQRLADWAAAAPRDPEVAYLRGAVAQAQNDAARAVREYEQTLQIEPRHEPARTELAALHEQQDRFERAAEHDAILASAAPHRESAVVGLARNLRKLARADAAREVLQRFASRADSSPDLALERAEIEFELGDYEAAVRWFERGGLDRPLMSDLLRTAATAYALAGDAAAAEDFFRLVSQSQDYTRRLELLRVRTALDPSDREAARELQQLAQSTPAEAFPAAEAPEARSALYRRHCAACHGTRGAGDGRAARHLDPRPRDFRNEPFHLVSTRNRVPSAGDVEAVIRQGMLGTGMPAFEGLSDDQRQRLAREVLEIRGEGVRERLAAAFAAAGDRPEGDALSEAVAARTTPSAPLPLPDFNASDRQAVARGRETYLRLACDRCHGSDGSGAWDLPLFDDDGHPAVPRDLVAEPMKGGSDTASLYRRLRLGMPGTPHPANPEAAESDLVALVHYLRTLAAEPNRSKGNYARFRLASRRAFLARFGVSPPPMAPIVPTDGSD